LRARLAEIQPLAMLATKLISAVQLIPEGGR
jgi:hypothetical protein